MVSFSCHHIPPANPGFLVLDMKSWSNRPIDSDNEDSAVAVRYGNNNKTRQKREKTKRKQLTTTAATGSFEIAATSKSSTVKLLSAFWTFRCYFSCQIRQIVVALLYWLRFPGQSNQRRIGSSHFISTGYYTFKRILILNEAVMPSSFRMVKSPDVGKRCRDNGQF